MKYITIKLDDEDALLISSNLKSLSFSLGKQLNLSELLRHVLRNATTKKYLYDLGFISMIELHRTPVFKKGKKNIILKVKKLCK